jgi:cysteine-rich repeat protein
MSACLGAGVCTPWRCTPMSVTCGGATSLSTCSADGQSMMPTSCPTGQSCAAGACAVRCGDGLVGAGETCDDNNNVGGDGCSATCALEPCASMDFSAGGSATIAQTPVLDLSTSWTLSYWARTSSTQPNGAVFTNQVSGSDCGTITVGHYPTDGLEIEASVAGCGSQRFSVATRYSLPMGVWTHIAVVVSGTNLTAYANGGMIHSETIPAIDPGVGARPFRVGTDGVFGFAGQVAELALWNRAMSPTELAMIRTGGLRMLTADPSLVLALPADEGNGTSVRDVSGRANTVSLVSPARWSSSCPRRAM